MRKLASVQIVNAAEAIPNADAIERIRVLGWWVVVKKGEFKPGDKLVYCEIDSLLPEQPEFEFLRPNCYKAAVIDAAGTVLQAPGFRIKTIKLRGQVSGSFPGFLPKTDETRVQVLERVIERHRGLTFYVTEKLDGTSFTAF